MGRILVGLNQQDLIASSYERGWLSMAVAKIVAVVLGSGAEVIWV